MAWEQALLHRRNFIPCAFGTTGISSPGFGGDRFRDLWGTTIDISNCRRGFFFELFGEAA